MSDGLLIAMLGGCQLRLACLCKGADEWILNAVILLQLSVYRVQVFPDEKSVWCPSTTYKSFNR